MALSSERQEEIYKSLIPEERVTVDRAMEYAKTGDYGSATVSYVSDVSKSGASVSPLTASILKDYSKSPEKFREGLLGFYYSK
ncbi:uncharacterized protein BBA_06825 [Beauveria bassiana ARSEF 2860]|uniref:Uncharacterized protein n=1 Tax=Beauveria bassiana (strain ARSEF 2860) TaxID=655819 RepID=J5JLW9_BEAB2|nr:uncharacterized protein BBA_06825 [Beauveria bassiana ARSEF 2860]EJP64121.1 hypothetical protein BBA_06825 [Beauveria bassiana ARSEF 2860]